MQITSSDDKTPEELRQEALNRVKKRLVEISTTINELAAVAAVLKREVQNFGADLSGLE